MYPLPPRLKFLFFYNTSVATLWLCCFGRFLILLPLVGRSFLPGGIADFFHVVAFTPIGAVVLVKGLANKGSLWNLASSLRMVIMCFGVIFPHPKIAKHTSYSLLITSWCLSNVIHFSYQAFKVKIKASPHFLFWLEYHHHYLTFPLAFIAEVVLIFLSLHFIEDDLPFEWLVKVVLVSYIPLGYFGWRFLNNRRLEKYGLVMTRRTERLAREELEMTTNVTEASVAMP